MPHSSLAGSANDNPFLSDKNDPLHKAQGGRYLSCPDALVFVVLEG